MRAPASETRIGRCGFSLVELLVVITVLGILATLGLPRLAATRQRAALASMTSDLRNLVAAQEGFFSAYGDYAGGIAGTEVPGPGAQGRVATTPSPGNVIVVNRRQPQSNLGPGWSATATNPMVTTAGFSACGVFVGAQVYAPNKAVTVEGAVACY